MLTFDSIPQARVVRKGGHEFTPPPAPPHDDPSVIRDHVRAVVSVALDISLTHNVITARPAYRYAHEYTWSDHFGTSGCAVSTPEASWSG